MMSDRAKIAKARQRMIKVADLLKQTDTGATTFSAPTEDGKYEILHNGKKTGVFIAESLYVAVMTKNLPGRPKISIPGEQIEELTPEILEQEFPTVHEYMEAVCIYVMMMNNVRASAVEMEVQRTAKDTLKWTVRAVDDDPVNEDGDAQAGQS